VLANCPFHELAREHTALVCGMNLHLIAAMLDELGQAPGARRTRPGTGPMLRVADGRAGVDRRSRSWGSSSLDEPVAVAAVGGSVAAPAR
jgi:hypothetical protein